MSATEKDKPIKTKSLPAGPLPGSLVGIPAAHGKKLQLLMGLLDEVSRLHYSLSAVAERIHESGEAGSARRALLRALVELGAHTVPDLARMRSVSRQFIQMEVNGLLADGFVEYVDNPAHKRSKFVRITPKGFALYKALRHREEPLGQWLVDTFSKSDLRTAMDFLERLRLRADDFVPGMPAVPAESEPD
ncbi:MAG: MarR family transcriptional regulator [Rhizobiales bacterium]|nr:MarR family transcriptional regulator [Hyphomicrobiales bacterium]